MALSDAAVQVLCAEPPDAQTLLFSDDAAAEEARSGRWDPKRDLRLGWNVVRGDMSLVGPRPIIDQELERYGADVDYYLMAKPGMTGLWQVSGRSNTDYATRVSLDVAYVKDWSLSRDITILFKTFKVVLYGSGAY